MFHFVPGGIKSAYRTSSSLRLKGSSMPFRRRRPCQHSFQIKWWVPYHFPSQQPPAKYLVMTDEPFLKGTVVGFKCSQEVTASTLSTFIVIFQPNTSFLGFQGPFFTFSLSKSGVFLFVCPHTSCQKWFSCLFFPPNKKPMKFGLLGPSRISISPTR